MAWTREQLRHDGFGGFVSWAAMERSHIPAEAGVYVVLRDPGTTADFLEASAGGWFKGRNPSARPDVLAAAWVEAADILYIGKATSLRNRLWAYRQFGDGRPVGHWGGRYIWQLTDSQALVVAWRPTPDESPRDVERRMIADFVQSYGRRPFANLRG
ncbi:hypothetical protein ABIB37_000820 [Agrococcus sp. UYP10]|uniref:hypothetical protein n=1 Tax=Agrococcus sp. UYP10 TaxID=1756355 RepID=UPI003394B090